MELSLKLHDDAGIMQKPFSLLARHDPEPEPVTPLRQDGFQNPKSSDQGEYDDTVNDAVCEDALQQAQEQAAKRREEKLQSDIFILKKLNSSFELLNDALNDAGSANQRIVTQLQQTNTLLDKYVEILSKSEGISRLIFDTSWHGADADEATMEWERLEKEKRIQLEKEAEARRVKQEIEQEKELQAQAEEREHLQQEKSARAFRGVRGVRGTRASMRGIRGSALPRQEASSTASRGIPRRPHSSLESWK